MTTGKYYGKPNKIKTNRTENILINVYMEEMLKRKKHIFISKVLFTNCICLNLYCQTICLRKSFRILWYFPGIAVI